MSCMSKSFIRSFSILIFQELKSLSKTEKQRNSKITETTAHNTLNFTLFWGGLDSAQVLPKDNRVLSFPFLNKTVPLAFQNFAKNRYRICVVPLNLAYILCLSFFPKYFGQHCSGFIII